MDRLTDEDIEDLYQEHLLSEMWRAWCEFVKEVMKDRI